jgi:dienelactone hydrolase
MFAALLLSVAPCQPPAKEPLPGRAMIDAYFARQVKQIADNCLNDLTTKEDWERRRPELRRQFLEMMGLWPLPERTDLKATVTGTVEGEGYTVEKLHFQSKPGLYVTANVYTPNPKPPGKLPAILYVCGHGNIVENGISYGSKVSYQYHPAWFAKHGYVCIILDTLQLGEIKGEHHGTYKLNQWWWQSRGYTPGGVELWNAMRALDYLETRPDVDMKKIGVTGRSGGGATSWWVAAADDRPAAIAPIAGIADLESHVCKGYTERLKAGVIAGHCDCMYMVNTYRWDFAQVAALAAPRPLLLGNSDADDIFPVPGYRSIASKVGKVYDLYGKRDYFDLLETKGPHKDTPELRIGINRFMNKWLKGDTTTKVEDDLPPKLPATALKVLKEMPKDAINEKIAETFVITAGEWSIPKDLKDVGAWWFNQRVWLIEQLKKKSFVGWTQKTFLNDVDSASFAQRYNLHHKYINIESEEGVELELHAMYVKGEKAKKVTIVVVDDEDVKDWTDIVRANASGPLVIPTRNILDKIKSLQKKVSEIEAIVILGIRGYSIIMWAEPGSTDETHIRRRFPLIGQTIDGQRIWDIRRTVQVLKSMPEFRDADLTLTGTGLSASLACYAAIFEKDVKSLELTSPPLKSRDAPILLNGEKVISDQRIVPLLAGKPVTIIVKSEAEKKSWDWTLDFAKRSGVEVPKVIVKP